MIFSESLKNHQFPFWIQGYKVIHVCRNINSYPDRTKGQIVNCKLFVSDLPYVCNKDCIYRINYNWSVWQRGIACQGAIHKVGTPQNGRFWAPHLPLYSKIRFGLTPHPTPVQAYFCNTFSKYIGCKKSKNMNRTNP